MTNEKNEINLEEIFKDLGGRSVEIGAMVEKLCNCTYAAAKTADLIIFTLKDSPELLIEFLLSESKLRPLMQALVAYYFEAGRIYGRTELIHEIEPHD